MFLSHNKYCFLQFVCVASKGKNISEMKWTLNRTEQKGATLLAPSLNIHCGLRAHISDLDDFQQSHCFTSYTWINIYPPPVASRERTKVSLFLFLFAILCCQYLTLLCSENISLGLSFLSKLCKLFFNFKEAKIVEEKKYINNSRDVLIYLYL